ncbi:MULTISPECIES: chemotaxis protein [Rhizobium/Agrobacterium group]|jgi:chemotaxis protein MotC|uniref:Chemotaxis protein MotC n=1 Tax=Rhizobium soli TaxID=424798 RepID=A0A7X0JHM2_9HYPH|nr:MULTISPECIES: chemotaxis protein [Rhizobium/Agrobacterium group]MBB6507719.1 chemotaxis protein MotC [Rhizobium soli]MBD8652695.1 chemotaxis protein [Rhizobium sp. CFBP 13726]NSY16232.1 chemotaxis protein [Neorhizobium sp. AL 9.2.2]
MMRSRDRHNLLRSLVAGVFLAAAGNAVASEDLEPYKMIRSLQYLQDAIVAGDHSANEMQRFLLKTLDQRLRTASPDVFKDPRNVDAVFVFAMSGGNPQTLDFLAARDVDGEFDGRLARVLRRYFQGQGLTAVAAFEGLVKEYGTSPVGPYLALVAGNITANADPAKAIGYFDQVRLLAPGTNLEEAALRRSLAVILPTEPGRGFDLAAKYVRRFLYSPYASQFIDMFVQLATDDDGKGDRSRWTDVVSMMDDPRAHEFYLRVSRRALLAGNKDLARFAALNAERLSPSPGSENNAIGQLYGDLASISSSNVVEAAKSLSQIPDGALSERDRNLRAAAQKVVEQILMAPETSSVSAEPVVMPAGEAGQAATASATIPSAPAPTTSVAKPAAKTENPEMEASLQTYVEQNRMKLKQIDDLLSDEAYE